MSQGDAFRNMVQSVGSLYTVWCGVSSMDFFLKPQSVFARFSNDYEFAKRDNWDGNGAHALSVSVIRSAEDLIRQYGDTTNLIEVAPGRDGSLSFVWDDDQENYIYLDVGPRDTIHLFYEMAGKAKWEGVSVATDPEIIRHVQRAFSLFYPHIQMVFVVQGSAASQNFGLVTA